MPLFEYHCDPCDLTFETLVRNTSELVHCPRCGGDEVKKQLSIPAAVHTGRSPAGRLPLCSETGQPSFGCGRPSCGSGVCAELE
jgi:putative FmdB family regulatory protein